MRKVTKGILLGAAAVATAGTVALMTGFPRRYGLTRTEADLSLPGDLLLPDATVQADRAHHFQIEAAQLWPNLIAVAELYELLWGRPLTLKYDKIGEVVVWQTAAGEGPFEASLCAALLPSVDGEVVVHLRERYLPTTKAGRRLVGRLVLATATVAPGVWGRLAS